MEKLGIRWGSVEKGKDKLIDTIGYDLQKEFWGKGIMKETLQTIIRYGFEQLKVNFQKEGILRDWMYWSGKHGDMSMFALLRSDWKA